MICARGPAADPSQPAGQLRAAGNPPGLQQAAGAVAVPQLAEQERAARARCKEVSSTADAGRAGPARAGRRGRRQPAGGRALRPAHPVRDIEDSPYNETRFAVIGHQKCGKTGHDKTAVMFRVPHNPGSLVDALDVFKQNKINLTWIESFPAAAAEAGVRLLRRFRGPRRGRPRSSRALQGPAGALRGSDRPRLVPDGDDRAAE